jgi:chromosome segregation ATPase
MLILEQLTLQDLQRELKILQRRVTGHDLKLEQTSEKLELDYSELKGLKTRLDETDEKVAGSLKECESLRERVVQNEEGLKSTTERLESLEETVEGDRAKTIVQIADHCERLDHESNKSKSHCVLITGINYRQAILGPIHKDLNFVSNSYRAKK